MRFPIPLLAVLTGAAASAAIAGCSAPSPAPPAKAVEGAVPSPPKLVIAEAEDPALAGLLAARSAELKKAALPGFTVRVVRPFVVVSDEAEEIVARRVARVIEPAIAWLERAYFRAEPAGAIAIWLCEGPASYQRAARSLTGRAPSTPFGFYSAEGGALRGVVNWRLGKLQRAAADGSVPSIADLVRLSPEAFYGDGSELNYAAARYLCLLLQERGALAELYRRLRDGAAKSTDPAADAEKALVELLGASTATEADAVFRAWVAGLKATGSPS